MDITSPFQTIYTEVWERQNDDRFLMQEINANEDFSNYYDE